MLIILLLFASLVTPQIQSAHMVNPQDMPVTEIFDNSVNQWIRELAKQDEFSDWKSDSMKWDRHPLGPGLHSWIVILTDHHQELGYLVVSVDSEGAYHLSEYGHGEYPLFSENTLYQSLVQHELIDSSITFEQFLLDHHVTRERIYISPLQNIWNVSIHHETYQIDAKTGDLMSIHPDILEELVHNDHHSWTAPSADTIYVDKSLLIPSTDPFYDLSWIHNPPNKVKDLQQVQACLHSGQSLTFVADLFDDTAIYALSVTGYHQWNAGDPFIAVEQAGTRYIPAQLLMESGSYYEN